MPDSETKICQNCKTSFVIDASDFAFYEKISVPPPTWCPECRLVRRLQFGNQRSLYKRRCDLCGSDMISMFSAEFLSPVYCSPCWWSDKWDPLTYGREYDFSKPFLVQLQDLLHATPVPALQVKYQTLTDSQYVNMGHNLKNCYLLFNSDYNENGLYSSEAEHSQDFADLMMADASRLSYASVNIRNCYRTFYSVDCDSCQDIWFSRDLVNCSNCFGCVNLRGKQYHVFNQAYSKEEYLEKMKEFRLGSWSTFTLLREKVDALAMRSPRKFMHGSQNSNVSGDYIYHSKDIKNTFGALESENCKFCMWLIIKPNKDCYDYTQFGENTQRVYDAALGGININNVKFSFVFVEARNSEFLLYCFGASSLLGCVSLRNKQYCILNKQYTKEEYEALVPRIIEHMNSMPYVDKKGRVYKYGEFFPPELSPFAYNETIAQEYFPLTKEEAEKQGYRWRDPDTKQYVVTKKPEDLLDHIKDVEDSILQETIGCLHAPNGQSTCNEQCTTAFRIIPEELQFYRRMNLPLPRLCPNCRHYERLKQRNPLKLWHRKCMCAGRKSETRNPKSETNTYENTAKHFHGDTACPNEFETSYAPDRPEIVYCEQCYNAEVA